MPSAIPVMAAPPAMPQAQAFQVRPAKAPSYLPLIIVLVVVFVLAVALLLFFALRK
jgi:flagellar basal body-associated protein FliL